MSTLNPLKFVGGLVLEVGAVIAALAILPGLGGSGLANFGQNSTPDRLALPAASADIVPNQVFFNADSSRVIDNPRATPPAAWQNDFAPPPPVSQQRYVENMLDHNSQRALDAAARLLNQGDRILPPELRVRREAPQSNQYAGEPIRQYQQSQYPTQPQQSRYPQPQNLQPRSSYPLDREAIAEDVLPSSPEVYRQPSPSHYAPSAPVNGTPPRYSAQEPPRRLDGRY